MGIQKVKETSDKKNVSQERNSTNRKNFVHEIFKKIISKKQPFESPNRLFYKSSEKKEFFST